MWRCFQALSFLCSTLRSEFIIPSDFHSSKISNINIVTLVHAGKVHGNKIFYFESIYGKLTTPLKINSLDGVCGYILLVCSSFSSIQQHRNPLRGWIVCSTWIFQFGKSLWFRTINWNVLINYTSFLERFKSLSRWRAEAKKVSIKTSWKWRQNFIICSGGAVKNWRFDVDLC